MCSKVWARLTQRLTIDTKRLTKEIFSKEYMLQTGGFTFAYLGLFIPFYYLSLFAIKHGVEPGFAIYWRSLTPAHSSGGSSRGCSQINPDRQSTPLY